MHAAPKGAPPAHAAADAASAGAAVGAPPAATSRGGHKRRYFDSSDAVSAARPASDSALSGGAPPLKASSSKICPRQQKGDVAAAVFTRGQLLFKLQPTMGHQKLAPVEGQKEDVTPLSEAPCGAAQGAAAAGSPATPAAPFTKMLTVRAGLGTRPDQMPLATPAFTVSAGAPHFSQQQLLPTGHTPYAVATLGA